MIATADRALDGPCSSNQAVARHPYLRLRLKGPIFAPQLHHRTAGAGDWGLGLAIRRLSERRRACRIGGGVSARSRGPRDRNALGILRGFAAVRRAGFDRDRRSAADHGAIDLAMPPSPRRRSRTGRGGRRRRGKRIGRLLLASDRHGASDAIGAGWSSVMIRQAFAMSVLLAPHVRARVTFPYHHAVNPRPSQVTTRL